MEGLGLNAELSPAKVLMKQVIKKIMSSRQRGKQNQTNSKPPLPIVTTSLFYDAVYVHSFISLLVNSHFLSFRQPSILLFFHWHASHDCRDLLTQKSFFHEPLTPSSTHLQHILRIPPYFSLIKCWLTSPPSQLLTAYPLPYPLLTSIPLFSSYPSLLPYSPPIYLNSHLLLCPTFITQLPLLLLTYPLHIIHLIRYSFFLPPFTHPINAHPAQRPPATEAHPSL